MTELEVRKVRFDFETADVPFMWSPQNPAFSFRINAISIIAICFEKMIVAAVREAMPLITDPASQRRRTLSCARRPSTPARIASTFAP